MSFRPDRTASHVGTHAETGAYHRAQAPTALAERLRVAMYLNSGALNFDTNNPPRTGPHGVFVLRPRGALNMGNIGRSANF